MTDSKDLAIRNSTAEFLIFQTQSKEDSIEVKYADETVWLSQKMMAELFDVEINTINYHLKEIFKSVPVSSLKSYIGHTLGASTIDEIAICIDMMETEKIYQRIDFTDAMDPMIPEKTCDLKVKYFLWNNLLQLVLVTLLYSQIFIVHKLLQYEIKLLLIIS